MASIVYDSFLGDVFAGNCNTSHSYKAMLVTSGYSENRGTHAKRSSVTNEVSGTNYSAGGAAVTVSFSLDTTAHTGTLTIGAVSWPSSTITARKLVVYRARGGASSADELVCVVDNGIDLASSGTTMTWGGGAWSIPLPAPA